MGEFTLGLPPSRSSDWLADIRRALDDDWVAPLRDAGVTYRTELLEGGAVSTVLATADREQADAIVVGKPVRGALSEHLSSSLAADLLHHSHRPVIVVPLA
jgi:nucleotide-binding universal stress UspA family protein